MKTLQEHIEQELNEARNYPYSVSIMTPKGNISVTITLKNANDADAMDAWLEDQKDNTIYAADGGPNDVEI